MTIPKNTYVAPPTDINKKPFVTFMVPYRSVYVADLFTPFISSFNSLFGASEVELLIKIDQDDDVGIDLLNTLLPKYPHLDVRVFSFNRWEGQCSITQFYNFMFGRKNPSSKFVCILSDDSTFNRNVLDDIKKYKDSDYCMIFNKDHCLGDNFKGDDYNTSTFICNPTWTEPYPIVSSKIWEICNGFGHMFNMDMAIALINLILVQDYNINIVKPIGGWTIRGGEGISRPFSCFNHETTSGRAYDIPNLLVIYKQLAKNIYLNMKSDGVI